MRAGPDDVDGAVTSQVRTLVDCMRNLPWDEAVAIVNSAIRADDFTQAEIQQIAEATGVGGAGGSARWPRPSRASAPTRSRPSSTRRRSSSRDSKAVPQLTIVGDG